MTNTRIRLAEIFNQRFGMACDAVARAPGRVNLLGEHVDYNGGWVLPAAIDRATYVAFGRGDEETCEVFAADFNEQARISFAEVAKGRSAAGDMAEWARYPAGVAWSLAQRGLTIKGMRAVIASDVPRGAGLSSSASVELAFAVAWQALGGWRLAPMDMALTCQRAENDYVGVNCGIMDQAASACGEAGRLLLLDCRSLEYQTLPLPADASIVIADTGVRHSLSSSAYNDRRAACEAAVRLLSRELPDIRLLRDVSLADFDRLAHILPDEVERRARHVVEEIARTQQAIKLLAAGDLEAFGALMNQCHASLRDLYEVSCPELDAMARIAQSLKGCYGARLTGAGFGGCTVNLVERDQAAAFTQQLGARYAAETGRKAEIYVCSAAAGAGLI
jgi:galactokinase